MALISSDRLRFPYEPWKLVENIHVPGDEGTLETLFALGNGHLGIRGSHSTARRRRASRHVHQRFPRNLGHQARRECLRLCPHRPADPLRPGRQQLHRFIDGEALSLAESTVLDYHRSVDFATGIYE